jgi:hypothetical protein
MSNIAQLCLALVFATTPPSVAMAQQQDVMRLEAATADVAIEIDGALVGNWELDPNNYPRDISLPVEKVGPSTICFVNKARRTCADFMREQSRPLRIMFNGNEIATEIRAQRDTPPAVFNAAYQAAHRGKTVVEVPEVYELVNIVIAISPYGQGDSDMVYHDSPYYAAVQTHFARYVDHPLIKRVDTMLRTNRMDYFAFKMNGYAFVFDAEGRIVRSPVYDRTGFAGSLDNAVLPFLADLQDFAKISGFREFYREHRDLYRQQIRFFEEEAQVARIGSWLGEQFPSVKPYDGVKIVFSPLVAFNQSLTTIEADDYRELQPHVNYPYIANRRLSPKGASAERSATLFTEMNHGFINPVAKENRERITKALGNRGIWADDTKAPANYRGAEALFNEYMNWALVSLYYRDLMTAEDFAVAHGTMVDNMRKGRGFLRFDSFDAELLRLYVARNPGQTVEDLFPAMLDWIETQQAGLSAVSAFETD